MSMLRIVNPATGKLIAEVLEDNTVSIKRKYRLARDTQPAQDAVDRELTAAANLIYGTDPEIIHTGNCS